MSSYDEERDKPRFNDIYQNVYEDASKENVSIRLKDNTYFTLPAAQKFLINLPNEQLCKKDAKLNLVHFHENEISKLNDINDAIFGMKPSLESGYIEACKMKNNANIKFFNAGFYEQYDSKQESTSIIFRPPRFEVKVTAGIDPGMTVCINTGYILSMPVNVKARKIENDEIIKDETTSTQVQFAVLSKLISNNQGILFTDSNGHDGKDKGFLAFSLTIIGEYDPEKWLIFELHAFKVCVPRNISILNAQGDAKILKNKDTVDDRNVCTPKIGILTNEFNKLNSENGFVQMKTFDVKNDQKVVNESQMVTIGDAFILVPRKRNWNNPNVVTSLGIYIPNEKSLPPIFVSGSDIKTKTHSFIFVANKIQLFSGDGQPQDDMCFLNGFFKGCFPNYGKIISYWRQIIKSKRALSYGIDSCNELCKQNPELDFWKVLYIFDFHHRINLQLAQEMCNMTDKELFESHTTDRKGSYSAIIYHSLCGLAKLFGLTPFEDDLKLESPASPELLDEPEFKKPKIIECPNSQ